MLIRNAIFCLLIMLVGSAFCSDELVQSSNWSHLPRHTKVVFDDMNWVNMVWSEDHIQLVSQRGPSAYVCFFGHYMRAVARYMDLLVQQLNPYTIQIEQIASPVARENPDGVGVIQVHLKADYNLPKTHAEMLFFIGNMMLRKEERTFDQPSARINLEVEDNTLCVFVGTHKAFDILPIKPVTARAGQRRFHFTPTFWPEGEPEEAFTIRSISRRRVLPSPRAILPIYCQEFARIWDGINSSFMYTQCVSVAEPLTRYGDILSLPGGKNYMLCPVAHMIVREMAAKIPFDPCESWSLQSKDRVGVDIFASKQPATVGKTPYELMSIQCEEVMTTMECTLERVRDAMVLRLYGQGDRRLLLGCFHFAESAFNANAKLTLYCGKDFPYMLYPIASTMVLGLFFGASTDEGTFYICNVSEPMCRLAFRDNRWMHQSIGVNEISLDVLSTYNTLPGVPLSTHGEVTPLFLVKPNQDALNKLFFYYYISNVDGHEYMSVGAYSPFGRMRSDVKEVNVYLSPDERLCYQIQTWSAEEGLVTQLTPLSFMTLLWSAPLAELKVHFKRGGFEELWQFSFENDMATSVDSGDATPSLIHPQ